MHALGPLLGVRVAGAGQLEDEDDDAAKVAAMIPKRAELAVAGPRTRCGVRRERAHGPYRPSVPRPLVRLMS